MHLMSAMVGSATVCVPAACRSWTIQYHDAVHQDALMVQYAARIHCNKETFYQHTPGSAFEDTDLSDCAAC